MLYDYSDYSGISSERLIPLLISERGQALLLAAIEHMQNSYVWLDGDDETNFDLIEDDVSEAIFEIIEEYIVPNQIPVGMVSWFPIYEANFPSGWLLCNGAVNSEDDYPELYAILPSDPYRSGLSAGEFRLPDLQSVFLYGSTFDSDVGDTGGSNTHTLTIDEMPAHSHTFLKGTAVASQVLRSALGNNSASTAQSTDIVGGGGSHNNMPAYHRGYWLIRALP